MKATVTRDQLSHDPRQAAIDREDAKRQARAQFKADREAAIAAERARNEQRRREKDEARRERGRAHGRKLDQIKTCYKQHTPPQIAFAEEMQACGS